MKIVVYTEMPGSEVLDNLKADFPQCTAVYPQNQAEFEKEIVDADIYAGRFITREVLATAKKLKYLNSFMAGVDKLPLKEIDERGIILTTGRGIHPVHMAEYAIAMMVLDARNLDKVLWNQKERKWALLPQDQISGKRLGILGLGAIGQELAQKANAMGLEVVGVKRRVEPVEGVKEVYALNELEKVFSTCDYIVNLLALTIETQGIINKQYFDMMKPTACMINMGRSGTTSEDDLYEALKNKVFRRYIVDVFDTEPLPEDNKLWELDNIVITPHICGHNVMYMQKGYEILRNNLKAFLDGRYDDMQNRFNHEQGY
jgi:phosphoglycerate dehydrogenase-like enzyme